MILDDDRLAPFARQPIRNNPWDSVGRSSGGEGYDDFDRVVRIALGPCRALKPTRSGKAEREHNRRSADPRAPLDHVAHPTSPMSFQRLICAFVTANGAGLREHAHE